MEVYNRLALVYDLFMDNVPYEKWTKEMVGIFHSYGIYGGIVADLGCGTGGFTQSLALEGYDMIGIDNSLEMLDIAMEKKARLGLDILYLCQDMQDFELYGTCRAIISRCDSLNYLIREEDFLQTLKWVNNYLDPGGIFIFDVNSPYKYAHLLGERVIAENREEASFIWENRFDPECELNEYALTLFIKEGKGYQKSEEIHVQRSYSLEKIQQMAGEAGLIWEKALDADTLEEIKEDTGRYLIIVRENGKEAAHE